MKQIARNEYVVVSPLRIPGGPSMKFADNEMCLTQRRVTRAHLLTHKELDLVQKQLKEMIGQHDGRLCTLAQGNWSQGLCRWLRWERWEETSRTRKRGCSLFLGPENMQKNMKTESEKSARSRMQDIFKAALYKKLGPGLLEEMIVACEPQKKTPDNTAHEVHSQIISRMWSNVAHEQIRACLQEEHGMRGKLSHPRNGWNGMVRYVLQESAVKLACRTALLCFGHTSMMQESSGAGNRNISKLKQVLKRTDEAIARLPRLKSTCRIQVDDKRGCRPYRSVTIHPYHG